MGIHTHMSYCINLQDTLLAYSRISSKVHKTPIISASSIKTPFKSLHFKCENLQKTGSFKFRGATNACAVLKSKPDLKCVVTHSSGNHGQALALAAKELGLPAHIVMPSN